MNIDQITSAILSGNFTNEELTSIFNAVKLEKSIIAEKNKRIFSHGSRVKFTNSRTNGVIEGVIMRISKKTVTIHTNLGTNWRVPANMLSVA